MTEIDLDRVAKLLRDDHGIADAYVEQTGGGCATLMAGKLGDSPDGGNWAALAGPGWFIELEGRMQARASLDDFHVGPDDDGVTKPETLTAGTESAIAAIIARHVAANRPAEEYRPNGVLGAEPVTGADILLSTDPMPSLRRLHYAWTHAARAFCGWSIAPRRVHATGRDRLTVATCGTCQLVVRLVEDVDRAPSIELRDIRPFPGVADHLVVEVSCPHCGAIETSTDDLSGRALFAVEDLDYRSNEIAFSAELAGTDREPTVWAQVHPADAQHDGQRVCCTRCLRTVSLDDIEVAWS